MLPSLAICAFLATIFLRVEGFSSNSTTKISTTSSISSSSSSSVLISTDSSSSTTTPSSGASSTTSVPSSTNKFYSLDFSTSTPTSISTSGIPSAGNISTTDPSSSITPKLGKFVPSQSFGINGTITLAPAAPGIPTRIFTNATSYNSPTTNASITSPSLGLYLTISTDDNNQTVTQCPDHTGYHGIPYEKNSTCCDYYNASSVVDTSLFNSWITAGDNAGPSPSVGAIYGCCGPCSVRASSVQIFYWPSAARLATCTTYTTFTDTFLADTFTLTVSGAVTTSTIPASTWTDVIPDEYYVDPALGCGGNGIYSNYTMFTTVVDDYTMTSPTPYIRFTSFYRYNWCGRLEGYDDFINSLTTGLATLASVETSTVTTGDYQGVFTSEVYNDVNFTQYEECTNADPPCEPIVKLDFYNYGMGRFKGCDPIVNGYYDPPVALTKATGSLGGGPTPPPVGGYGGIGNGDGGPAKPGSGPNAPTQPVQTGGGGNNPAGSNNGASGNGNGRTNNGGTGGTDDGTGGNNNGDGGTNKGNSNGGNGASKKGDGDSNTGSGGNQEGGGGNNGGQNNGNNQDSNPIVAITAILGGNGNNNPTLPAQDQPGGNPPEANPLPPIIVGGQTYIPNSNGQYIVGSQTLLVGGPTITVAGTPVAIAPGAGAVIVGSNTQILNPDPASAISGPPTPFLSITVGPNPVGIRTITAANGSPEGYVIDGKTLVPGGAPIVISGTTLSLSADTSVTAVVMNDGHGHTTSIPMAPESGGSPPRLTVGLNVFTLNSRGEYVSGSQTLIPGGVPIVVDGTTLSLSAGPTETGMVVVNDGSISIMPLSYGNILPMTIVAGTHTLTLDPQGDYVYGTQTLKPGGPAITIDGIVFSLPPHATGPVTVGIDSILLGEIIMKGFGAMESSSKKAQSMSSSAHNTPDPTASQTASLQASPTQKNEAGCIGNVYLRQSTIGVLLFVLGVLAL